MLPMNVRVKWYGVFKKGLQRITRNGTFVGVNLDAIASQIAQYVDFVEEDGWQLIENGVKKIERLTKGD